MGKKIDPPGKKRLPAQDIALDKTIPQGEVLSGIVPDGDFAGMRADDVLNYIAEGIHEAMGSATIDFAGAALDAAMGEFLQVVQCVDGDKKARLFALRYCETVLPYATLPVTIETETYGNARQIKGRKS